MLFQHPDLFASAGLFGSGLLAREEALLRSWLDEVSPTERPRFFFNVGEQDLMLAQAQAMIDVLDDSDIASTTVFTPGDHTFAYWIANLPTYFKWLAEEWQ
jgi:S-formylglutathione hydrolase FrmB